VTADYVGGLIEELAGRILRASEEVPPEAAERLGELARRAEEALMEWEAELQRLDLALPLSEDGRRLVAFAALLAARLLHETAGSLKLTGVPEGEAIGLAIAGAFSPRAGILVAAALEALVKQAERLAGEGAGGAQPSGGRR
jgi:hypothetical protein